MSDRKALPRGVWVLGLVSLLMDASSELIHGLLPVFMVSVLGATGLEIGLVEGAAEATALIVKVFSGTLSDRLGRRKELVVLGYGLAAASKPFFALASTVQAVLGARFVDRVGKGLRGAPRDALIADMTPPELRGAAFGLRQSLDTVGAFLGPAAGVLLMLALHGRFRTIFWLATVPAALSVALVAAGVSEKEPEGPRPARRALEWGALREFPARYWAVVLAGVLLTLARFSEAFLILRARQRGLPDAYAPAVFIVMNLVYALGAYPAGLLSDRLGSRRLLAAGVLALAGADAALAAAGGLPLVALGVVLWGLHLALSQGLLAALVAASAPPSLRGTGFGLFNLAAGATMLVSSAAAGLVWDRVGPGATFLFGAAPAAVTLVLLLYGRLPAGADARPS